MSQLFLAWPQLFPIMIFKSKYLNCRFRRTDDSLIELVWPEKFQKGRSDLEKRRDEKFKSRLRLSKSSTIFKVDWLIMQYLKGFK